ncbi:MAG: hypothetical protein AVDCRST_MAG73-4230, partial [uncultured Thermomicrobiales bacterium]
RRRWWSCFCSCSATSYRACGCRGSRA